MIHQLDFNGRDKVDKAIMRLQTYEPPEGYYLCFSGGKDSVVIKALADMAGVKYDAHYNISSVDPPELVRFIKDKHPDVIMEHPKDKGGNCISMWTLIPQKQMPPTRLARYCCEHLKEHGGGGRLKVTGVRWAESTRRKVSHSEVTFADKKAKKTIEKELSDEDFSSTPQGGGGASIRQSRKRTNCRNVLQEPHNNGEPYHRLDNRRSVGVHTRKQPAVLLFV